MAAYLIADVEVIDGAAYETYRQQVPAVIAAHGGPLRAVRERAAKSNIVAIAGL